MHRINGMGATLDNQFSQGNPATGVPATTVTPDWLNSVQEELARAVISAGMELNPNDNEQLKRAIPILAGWVRAADHPGANGSEKVQAAIDSLGGGRGFILINRGIVYDYSALAVPPEVVILDEENTRIILSHTCLEPAIAAQGHLVICDARPNTAVRVHAEPTGSPVGTRSKYDWMFDAFRVDQVNYRIANRFTYDDGSGNTPGYAVDSVKSVGDFFGVWPAWHFGFQDSSDVATVMSLYYFDTSDSSWRAPQLGAWIEGRIVAGGAYCLANGKLYQADAPGICGGVKPSHPVGSVSDGGVNWTCIRDYTAAANAGHIKPVIVIGDKNDRPVFGLPGVRMQWSKDTALWNGVKQNFLKADGSVAWSISCHPNTGDLFIESPDGTKALRFGGGFVQSVGMAWLMNPKAITDNSTAINVTGTELIVFGNTAPTVVTEMTGGPYQRLIIQSSNGQTTIAANARIKTSTGANRVMTGNGTLEFVFDGTGMIAKELGTL